MSIFAPSPAVAPRAVLAWVPAAFAATIGLSALLLFAVQPIFTKLVMPKLGGAPAVWSVAMVAFQAFLFLGYVYAHVLTRLLSPRRAAMLHMAVLALVALTLPLGIARGFDTPPADGVMLWLIALFTVSIGLPFATLSATAPLLQNWFAVTRQDVNPYALYAASNLGSFAALLAYPVAVEPLLTLREQLSVWTFGFSVFVLLVATVGWFVVRNARPLARVKESVSRSSMAERLSWMALTAVPAGLCIAVTSYISTDIASAPFVWLVPLALYLLTFVAVFRDRAWISHASVLRLLPFLVVPLAVSVLGGARVYWFATIALNLVAFTVMALACHGEAYRRRPDAGRLTEFYLATSFGGLLGGLFAGLIAPNIFRDIYEYPLLIVMALLVMPGIFAGGVRGFLRGAALPLMIASLVLAAHFLFDLRLPRGMDIAIEVTLVVIVAIALLSIKHPSRIFGLVVLCFVVSGAWRAGISPVETARSFFGIHHVVDTSDGTHRLLLHGTTVHGAERRADVAGPPEPLTYYHFGGAIGQAISAARTAQHGLRNVAVVGLGTGSLACHAKAGESWTFFEIDPEVIRIARDPAYFSFMARCGADSAIVAGDARLTLAASKQLFDVIVLDAFSSNAIPVHLLTREAYEGYLSRLAPGGVIVAHVSNRHMELTSVVAAIAGELRLASYGKRDNTGDAPAGYRYNAEVVVLGRQPADVAILAAQPGWVQPRTMGVQPWSDDYSDMLRAILRKVNGPDPLSPQVQALTR